MNHWNDERLQRIISILLRSGVLLSAAMVLIGGACHLIRHGQEPTDYRTFRSAPPAYRSISGVVHALAPSDCGAIIQFGLLLLIATPIARVGLSLVGFSLERDWTYVALTLIVLAVLLYGIAFEH